MTDMEKYSNQTFEEYKQKNEFEEDFWYARDLAQILGYKRFDKFLNVIEPIS